MPYYVRAFCTAVSPPTINAVVQVLRGRGLDLRAKTEEAEDLNSADWQQFELFYKPGKEPIVVECSRDEGEGSLAKAEFQEFIQQVSELEDAPGKDAVLEHLSECRFIVSCQLLSDIDDDGFEVNGQFLGYFVEHCGGMVQADGEGFYERAELGALILPLE